MFARPELVPTAAERAQRYYEGIDLGGSLYDADAADIPGHLPDPERHRTAGPSDTDRSEGRYSEPSEGRYFGPSDRRVGIPDPVIWRFQTSRVAVGDP
jgi:hypothetical protein